VFSENKEIIESIAWELNAQESLIEKDWLAMRLMAAITKIKHEGLQLVFSGGTSLSKGYGLIQRFSEDLDFKMKFSSKSTRSQRSKYRKQIVEAIRTTNAGWKLKDDDILVGNQSQFFSLQIAYQSMFTPIAALRPYLKLEVTFANPSFPCEVKSLTSFVAQAQKEPPEVASILCVSPVETAADKLSALTWRVLSRKRGSPKDDPTLIRHLYDLTALETAVTGNKDFSPLVKIIFAKDVGRGKSREDIGKLNHLDQIQEALHILETDQEYLVEYDRFVTGMSYAQEQPSFADSLQAIYRIMAIL